MVILSQATVHCGQSSFLQSVRLFLFSKNLRLLIRLSAQFTRTSSGNSAIRKALAHALASIFSFNILMQQSINYSVIAPSGNLTAIVTTPVARSRQIPLATAILNRNQAIEQVGFLEISQNTGCIRLQMMGGEFCGNAVRAIAFLLYRNRLSPITMEVSGNDQPVTVTVSSRNIVTLQMAVSVLEMREVVDGTIVVLPGITHIVVPVQILPSNPSTYARFLLQKYHLLQEVASGVMFFCSNMIFPYVWVKGTQTLIAETACASGSLAVLIAQKKRFLALEQPSSAYLTICRENDTISISGPVWMLGSRKLQLQHAF